MKIKDLGTVVTGKTPSTKQKEYWNGKIHFVTPADLQRGKHVFKTDRYITDAGKNAVKGSILPSNSICVSCIGNIGYVSITTQECVSNQQINAIIPNQNNDPDFIYYLMKNLWPYFKNYEGQSTTVSILNKSQFSDIDVPEIDINTQKRIASVLSSIDSKIELNNKINDNLSNYIPIESTSISPDISLGNNKSRKFDNFSFSRPFLKIISKDVVHNWLNFSNNSLGGIEICSFSKKPFRSKFLIPVVPFSYIKNRSLSYKYCHKVYRNIDHPGFGLTARQKFVQTSPLSKCFKSDSEINATLPVDWVGLPPEISTTKSPLCNFLAA